MVQTGGTNAPANAPHHNGVYYARKGVPARLRPLVGKWTVMVSLGTKDPDEARRLHPEAIREIEEWLAALEAGPKALSEREAHELASPIRDNWVALHRDNPSRNPWQTELFERLWRRRKIGLVGRPDYIYQVLHGEYADRGEDDMEMLCFEHADQLIKAKGLVVDKDGRRIIAKAVGAALQRASLTLERFALGDVADEAPPVRVRSVDSTPAPKALPSKVEFDELVKGWAAERKPAEKTLYDWKRVMVQLAEFLGHRDAARVTSEDLIAWKNSVVASGLAAKTIRESRLAPVRAILRWGVDNCRIAENAAERITITVKQKPGLGKRGFKDAEAAQILQAAATV